MNRPPGILVILWCILALVPGPMVRAQDPSGADTGPELLFIGHDGACADVASLARVGGVSPYEVPLASFLVRASGRTLAEILEYRHSGLGWSQLFSLVGVDPAIVYPTVDVIKFGGPYARAYEAFLRPHKEQTKWSDDDLVRLAAVHSLHELSGRPLSQVIGAYEEQRKASVTHRDRHTTAGPARNTLNTQVSTARRARGSSAVARNTKARATKVKASAASRAACGKKGGCGSKGTGKKGQRRK